MTDTLENDLETQVEVIDGNAVAVADGDKAIIVVDPLPTETEIRRRALLHYLILPISLLVVTLLGGIRFDGADGSILFLRPALICLVLAAGLVMLFFRGGMIRFDGWISERFSILKNVANGITLAALFAASVQIFNSLIPEQGLPFWVVSFCFVWTLWNNLFADFDAKKLLKSLGAMFGLAFTVKYLLLANLTAPAGQGWLSAIFENPTQTAFSWLLDLPRFGAATGYIQFFTLAIFGISLYFFPPTTED